MKKLIIRLSCGLYALFILTSCSTFKPVTHIEQPTIVLTDSNFCISGGLSAAINQDSLFYYLDKGVILGNGTNTVKIYWQSLGTSDPFNGQIVIEPNLCINNSDFCLTGQYWVQIHQTAFIATIQRGITFGTPAASVFIQYQNGKLTVTPKVCIKTRVTAKALR